MKSSEVLRSAGCCACAGSLLSVQLSATKSRMGHAEPAAGTVGIANLKTMLEHASSHALLHLTQARPC